MTINRPRRCLQKTVTLKTVARHVGLTPGTISATLNNSPAARSIPQGTKERILAAARELNYRPNFFARSLRKRRSYTIAVLAREIAEPGAGLVMSGIESFLRQKEYFLIAGVHGGDPELFTHYSSALAQRGVEGFITMDLAQVHALSLPAVNVATHGLQEEHNTADGPAGLRLRLMALGRMAAQTLLEEIEQRGAVSLQ
jgi:DNA-binding LacI/PurR family transcriptional regulator